MFKERLTRFIADIENFKNAVELQKTCDNLVTTLIQPWEGGRKPLSRRSARDFWSRELDDIAKERSRLYRIAKRSALTANWIKYGDKDCALKKKLVEQRVHALTTFSDVLRYPRMQRQRAVSEK